MEYIRDQQRLEQYLRQEKILCRFETENLDFRLVRYQKGELLTSPFKSLPDFLFLVQGKIKIYGLREDGSSFSISQGGDHRQSNLMSLCQSCHTKLHRELGDR